MHAACHAAIARSPSVAVPPPKHAGPEEHGVDAGRAFLGVNASYYDEAWRVMAWRGRRWSWNGAAFWCGPLWFAHRRMVGVAAAYVVLLVSLEALHLAGAPPLLTLGALATAMLLAGGHGNGVYLRHFTRNVRRIGKRSPSAGAYERALRQEGGTNPLLTAVATLSLALGLLWPLLAP